MVTLRIATGVHAGAELRLEPGEHLIGSDETTCDIVLFDAEVQPQHASLTIEHGAPPKLKALTEAGLKYEGKDYVGEEFRVARDGSVSIGSCTLVFTWDPSFTAKPEPDVRFAPVSQAEAAPVRAPVSSPARAKRSWQRAGVAAVTMGLVGIAFSLILNSLNTRATTENGSIAEVERVLQRMQYRELDVRRDATGDIVVSGYVASRAERERLENALRRVAPQGLRVQVMTAGSQRTYDAGIASSPTLTASADRKSVLMDGMGGPIIPKQTTAKTDDNEVQLHVRGVLVDDIGERILETMDGRRYTVGAVLPGGYTVMQLEEEYIVLTKGRDRFMYSLGPKPEEEHEEVEEPIGS